MLFRCSALVYGCSVVLLPETAGAISTVQLLGVFHLFVGLFITATFFVFASGVFVYFARLGTWPTHRDTAIEVMEWAIVMIFILVVVLGLVQFFQQHSAIALSILAFLVVVIVLVFLLRLAATRKEEKKKAAPDRAARR